MGTPWHAKAAAPLGEEGEAAAATMTKLHGSSQPPRSSDSGSGAARAHHSPASLSTPVRALLLSATTFMLIGAWRTAAGAAVQLSPGLGPASVVQAVAAWPAAAPAAAKLAYFVRNMPWLLLYAHVYNWVAFDSIIVVLAVAIAAASWLFRLPPRVQTVLVAVAWCAGMAAPLTGAWACTPAAAGLACSDYVRTSILDCPTCERSLEHLKYMHIMNHPKLGVFVALLALPTGGWQLLCSFMLYAAVLSVMGVSATRYGMDAAASACAHAPQALSWPALAAAAAEHVSLSTLAGTMAVPVLVNAASSWLLRLVAGAHHGPARGGGGRAVRAGAGSAKCADKAPAAAGLAGAATVCKQLQAPGRPGQQQPGAGAKRAVAAAPAQQGQAGRPAAKAGALPAAHRATSEQLLSRLQMRIQAAATRAAAAPRQRSRSPTLLYSTSIPHACLVVKLKSTPPVSEATQEALLRRAPQLVTQAIARCSGGQCSITQLAAFTSCVAIAAQLAGVGEGFNASELEAALRPLLAPGEELLEVKVEAAEQLVAAADGGCWCHPVALAAGKEEMQGVEVALPRQLLGDILAGGHGLRLVACDGGQERPVVDMRISCEEAAWDWDGLVRLQIPPGSCQGPILMLHVFSTGHGVHDGAAGTPPGARVSEVHRASVPLLVLPARATTEVCDLWAVMLHEYTQKHPEEHLEQVAGQVHSRFLSRFMFDLAMALGHGMTPPDLARLLSFLDAQGMDACAALLPAAEDASAVLAALVPGDAGAARAHHACRQPSKAPSPDSTGAGRQALDTGDQVAQLPPSSCYASAWKTNHQLHKQVLVQVVTWLVPVCALGFHAHGMAPSDAATSTRLVVAICGLGIFALLLGCVFVLRPAIFLRDRKQLWSACAMLGGAFALSAGWLYARDDVAHARPFSLVSARC